MRVPSINQRNRRASDEGLRLAEAFFLANPARRHWVRPSIPLELADWRSDDHLAAPIMLVQLLNSGDLMNIALAGDIAAVPNEERFLSLLMGHIRALQVSPGSRPILSPTIHAALLELAGHQVKSE
jgi:hypothetical protein